MELPFIRIDNVLLNLHHLQQIVREDDKVWLYFAGEGTQVPRVYRGTLAAAIWSSLTARVPHIEERPAHGPRPLRPAVSGMPPGQPLGGSEEATTLEI